MQYFNINTRIRMEFSQVWLYISAKNQAVVSSVIKMSVVLNKGKDIYADSQKHGFVHNPDR